MALIRVARVTFSSEETTIVADGLRVAFSSVYGIGVETRPSTVSVYNLSAERAAAIVEGMEVDVIGGYEDNPQTLFNHVVNRVRTARQGLNRITVAESSVTNRILNRFADFETEYTGPVKWKTIARDAVAGMGGTAESLEVFGEETIADFQFDGDCGQILNSFEDRFGITWTIQFGGIVRFHKEGEPTAAAGTHFVSMDTGMIEQPEPSEKGIRVAVLVDASILVGDKISVQTQGTLSGEYEVISLEHKGDTHGDQPWSTIMEATRVAA